MRIDAKSPSESFRKVFTNYLHGLPANTDIIRGTVMDQAWSHLGTTGVIGLILCLYLQAVYFGAGHDWHANMKHVEHIFNVILAIPEL